MLGLHFLNPAFLLGLGAVALPIIIHLVHLRKARQIEFSSLRFLTNLDERIARRHRLQEMAILAMRCGFLAFVAMALAKPLFRPEGTPLGGRGSTTAVIVIDDSYSMGLSEGGVTLFEQARASAMAIVKDLRSGDQVLVLPTHRMPAPGELRPSSDLGAATKAVSALALSHESTLLAPVIGVAYDLLARATTANRELYVFSDLQANGWAPMLEKGFADRPNDIAVYVAPLGTGEPRNLAVTGVEAMAAGGLREAPVWVTALVTNTGTHEEESHVSVLLDGRAVAEQSVKAQRGETVPVTLTLPAQPAGTHRGVVRLGSDALAEDNERNFVVDVREALRVLLVNGRPERTRYENSTYFLERALQPEAQADESRSAIVPTVCTVAELPTESLNAFAAVVLSDVPTLTPDTARVLADWVRTGGAVVAFLGPDVDASGWNDVLGRQAKLLPIRLGDAIGADAGGEVFFTLKDIAARHPLISALSRATPPVDLSTPRFFRYMKASLTGDVQVVARFTGGDPALVEARVGEGRVFLCLSSATTEWTNFPLRVSFLPFLHNLVYWLSEGERGATEMRVGTPIRFPYAAGSGVKSVSLMLPSGQKVVKTRPGAGAWEAAFDPVKEPGFVAWREEGGEGREATLAVNVDPSESDLQRVAKGDVEKAFPQGSLKLLSPGPDIASQRERSRNGVSLADAFLMIALALCLGELLLSNKIAFGGRARPVATPERAQLSGLGGG